MKVYVVSSSYTVTHDSAYGELTWDNVQGVFSSREKAQNFIDTQKKDENTKYIIEEFEVS